MNRKMVFSSILLAALGYFVDIYDLILFSIVRVKSLQAIGVPEDQLLSQGVFLLNMQMGGMLLGGIIWGIWGDKKGRLSVLLGSILLYSLANIANAFVTTVPQYAALRLIAGIGLAGELGAGITLVSEMMSKETRGYGTTIVAVVGILGAIAAALIGDMFDWRVSYLIGGGMGIGLLLLRIKAGESGMFKSIERSQVKRGNLLVIFSSLTNTLKYLRCILIGLPIWFIVGIFITFSPEFGKAFNMFLTPSAGKAVMFAYIGLALGDLSSGLLSQFLKSRKKAVGAFLFLSAFFMSMYLFAKEPSLNEFYLMCLGLGFAGGYWAVFVTIAAEQFGTNIRSTVATTVPNFVRGAVVPLTLSFQALKSSYGIVNAGWILTAFCLLVALLALYGLQETHGRDLDYLS